MNHFEPYAISKVYILMSSCYHIANDRLTSVDDYSRTFELCQMIDEVVPRACSWTTMGNYPPCANYLQ